MIKSSQLENMELNPVITPEKAEQIIDEYTSGGKFGDIQKKYEITHDDIAVLLAHYGIPRREAPKKIRYDCMLPDSAFACYRGKCTECGWNETVHAERVKRIRGCL